MNIPSASPIGTIAYQGASANAGASTLGADAFMKLLTTQLASQNPLEPMKDTEFIAQMASFTSLEQMRTLSKSFSEFAADQAMATAPSYLGLEVTLADVSTPAGEITGVVEAVEILDGQPVVIIGGKHYSTALISRITH